MADLRDALRALKATPVVTVVAILSLALGIGANTAIFSLVNTLMLRSLPVREPQRLGQMMSSPRRASFTNPLWEVLRDRERQLFDGAFAYAVTRFNLTRGGEAKQVNGVFASGGYFDVLGVPTILGRTFTVENDVRKGAGLEARQVAVISYSFWQQHYGGAADVLGKPLELDRVPFTIVGVTGPEFTGIDQGTSAEVFIPLASEPLIRGASESAMDQRSWWWLRVIGRLKPGDTIDRATAAVRGLQPQLREATLPNWRPQQLATYLKDPFVVRAAANGPNNLGRQYRDPLYLIMVVVALVLLIACANIANLLLARASARRHELSVRVALGASRWRIARQLLIESAVLAIAGTVLGLVFAQWGARLLVFELSGATTAAALDVGLDWRVLLFTIGLAGATTLLFGIVPALRSTRVAPSEAIKEQGRSVVGESRFGLGSWLVAAQVALSLVLLVGAGLFLRTFSTLAHVRLGFEFDPIIMVSANAKRSSVDLTTGRTALYGRLRETAATVPGVRDAALLSITPLTNSSWDTLIQSPEGLSLPESERDVYVNEVSPGLFATFGTPLLAGRDFTPADNLAAPRVIIVNETFARKYFGGASPIGHWVRNEPTPRSNNPPRLQIVGLVRDSVYDSLRDAIPPTMYQVFTQNEQPGPSATIVVRAAAGSPALLTRSLADTLGRVDGDVSLTFSPYRDSVRAATAQERVLAMLSAFFGGLALLLAGLGLYGVMSYAVSRRRTEIGIRMALGAGPGGAVRLILLRVAALVGAGIAAGTLIALWAARFMAGSSLIYGLQPRDPRALVSAAVALAAIGTIAGYLPARRASRIDPARVLRAG
jgi:predicted permease